MYYPSTWSTVNVQEVWAMVISYYWSQEEKIGLFKKMIIGFHK